MTDTEIFKFVSVEGRLPASSTDALQGVKLRRVADCLTNVRSRPALHGQLRSSCTIYLKGTFSGCSNQLRGLLPGDKMTTHWALSRLASNSWNSSNTILFHQTCSRTGKRSRLGEASGLFYKAVAKIGGPFWVNPTIRMNKKEAICL